MCNLPTLKTGTFKTAFLQAFLKGSFERGPSVLDGRLTSCSLEEQRPPAFFKARESLVSSGEIEEAACLALHFL